MGGSDWLFLETSQYVTLYTFVQSQSALNFANAFVQPVVGLAVNDAEKSGLPLVDAATVSEKVPLDFSFGPNYNIFTTLAWWCDVLSLGISEYMDPILNFDENTIAALATLNIIVNGGDAGIDLATALGNTALSTPSLLLLYSLYSTGSLGTENFTDDEMLQMFAAEDPNQIA